LAGGVGGAKLADGLAQVLAPEQLTIIGNTGDDFVHLGLTVCQDLDTVLYTLAGVANPDTGWGRAGESWTTLDEVARLGGPAWFRLGDLDLATHLTRTQLLRDGATLTEATAHLCRHLGVGPTLLPMTDTPAPTLVDTDEGVLAFQEWFVQKRWEPAVRRVVLPDDVRATPAVLRALEAADVVVFAPSNPFVSLDPILNVYPIREMIADLPQMVVAVSPIVGGEALKGPAAKMMTELSLPQSAAGVADYYAELVDLFVVDRVDANIRIAHEPHLLATDAVMRSRADRARLAQTTLDRVTELLAAE
jgi:LPPG:FO 2-phospho-L-lactate transferase